MFLSGCIGACTPDNISTKNHMSMDGDYDINVVTEVQGEQGGQHASRRTFREIAAQRRQETADRFKAYQERDKNVMRTRKNNKLRTKPLNQINLKRLSDDFNFNYRGIDGSTRQYLGKGKTERDVNMAAQEATLFKSNRK